MYVPAWEGPIEGYSKNFISKHLYKMEPLGYEFADLVQEAFLVYWKCKRMYENDVENPQHFMALFKRALQNRLFDLWYPRRNEEANRVDGEIEPEAREDVEREGTFRVMLSEAPKEVKEVISLFTKAPDEVLQFLGLNKRGRSLESSNRKLCELLGYDHRETDLIFAVKRYFSV